MRLTVGTPESCWLQDVSLFARSIHVYTRNDPGSMGAHSELTPFKAKNVEMSGELCPQSNEWIKYGTEHVLFRLSCSLSLSNQP